MNAGVGQAILGILVMGLAGAFAAAFGSTRDARRSVARIHARRNAFRAGGALIVLGVGFAAEADAVFALTSLARDDPRFTVPVLVGYGLIVLGVAVLDAVLWWPRSGHIDGSGSVPRAGVPDFRAP